MLNRPGEEVAAPPAAEPTAKSEGSPGMQIVLIAVAGLYLFGMVWLYAQLPWLAAGGTAVAVAIVLYGFIRRLRQPPGPTDC